MSPDTPPPSPRGQQNFQPVRRVTCVEVLFCGDAVANLYLLRAVI